MLFGLSLSETGSSLVHIALVLAVGLVVPIIMSPKASSHRAVLFAIATILTIRYLWWRATVTLAPPGFTMDCLASWSFFAIEAGAAISSISAFVLLSRNCDRKDEATLFENWWGADAPKVAIMIATYNEDKEVLERTIIGSQASIYPNFEVLVLDDGKRDWLRDFCAERGVRHITRSNNIGAKAGNLNNAIELLAAENPPDYLAVLDADFVPHRNFLTRTVALFHDRSVGLVQTPQHFFNTDPIQHNLGLSRSYPDEQRFFFDHLQPARDAWGVAFCCGTSSLIKWDAGVLPISPDRSASLI